MNLLPNHIKLRNKLKLFNQVSDIGLSFAAITDKSYANTVKSFVASLLCNSSGLQAMLQVSLTNENGLLVLTPRAALQRHVHIYEKTHNYTKMRIFFVLVMCGILNEEPLFDTADSSVAFKRSTAAY